MTYDLDGRMSNEALLRDIYKKEPDDTPLLNRMKADKEIHDAIVAVVGSDPKTCKPKVTISRAYDIVAAQFGKTRAQVVNAYLRVKT